MFTVDCTSDGYEYDPFFHCNDGACHPADYECDDWDDCEEGEDELNCHGEC